MKKYTLKLNTICGGYNTIKQTITEDERAIAKDLGINLDGVEEIHYDFNSIELKLTKDDIEENIFLKNIFSDTNYIKINLEDFVPRLKRLMQFVIDADFITYYDNEENGKMTSFIQYTNLDLFDILEGQNRKEKIYNIINDIALYIKEKLEICPLYDSFIIKPSDSKNSEYDDLDEYREESFKDIYYLSTLIYPQFHIEKCNEPLTRLSEIIIEYNNLFRKERTTKEISRASSYKLTINKYRSNRFLRGFRVHEKLLFIGIDANTLYLPIDKTLHFSFADVATNKILNVIYENETFVELDMCRFEHDLPDINDLEITPDTVKFDEYDTYASLVYKDVEALVGDTRKKRVKNLVDNILQYIECYYQLEEYDDEFNEEKIYEIYDRAQNYEDDDDYDDDIEEYHEECQQRYFFIKNIFDHFELPLTTEEEFREGMTKLLEINKNF